MATISKNLTVAAKSVYTLTINNIPTGSSVTPVNDIQTWLHCGNIWNKTYTTIAQVLLDTSTLQALIASNNAADYMARSTNWASSVCANQTAMGYIGNNDYCADALTADTTWLVAICNSAYMESVLNVKVPTMTSNTTPSGEAFTTSVYSYYEPYMAFNNAGTSTFWHANNTTYEPYIGYMFTQEICVRYFEFATPADTSRIPTKVVLMGSDDGSSWTNIMETTDISSTARAINKIKANTNNTSFKYYALKFVLGASSNGYTDTYYVQFYGRE
jgi:hypothetical protein